MNYSKISTHNYSKIVKLGKRLERDLKKQYFPNNNSYYYEKV